MYKVEWAPVTDEQLAAIWNEADSTQRRAIVEATNTIDRELKANPFLRSESRDEDRRVLFVPPLGVFFNVNVKRQVVWVGHVWYYQPRQKQS